MRNNDPLSLEILSNIFRASPKDPSRIINREGSSIEFKESYNNGSMAQYFRAIASFANNSGGYVLFGVGDKPRRLLGLKGKSLQQFEELDTDVFTRNLQDYFSPAIKWDHCTFEYREMSFGVIYVYPLRKKPCICKKHYEDSNAKYTLKEGDIYYRYGGKSERIHYEELQAIIEETRRREERQWLDFAKKAVRIGVSNAALLNLDTGTLSGTSGTVVLDEDLLNKIAFIHEGQFVENGGTPTLRVIGDVTEISTGKIVVRESTRKTVRAIEPGDIVQAFLTSQIVDEPMEYIKRICSATSANYPVYFFIQQAKVSISDAILLVKKSVARGTAKDKLIERLEGKVIDPRKIPTRISDASQKREVFRNCWLTEKMPDEIKDIGRCVESVLYLTNDEIKAHQKYIRDVLCKLFTVHYESVPSSVASNMRSAICRIDECLYFDI